LQSLDQVDERLGQTLLRLATIISGRAGTLREAREIADHLFRKDIYRIHHHKKVFGKVDPVPLIRGVGYHPPESLSQDKLSSQYYPYYILESEPQYMGLELQEEDAAGRIQRLGALEFLCRPAIGEVVPVCIADAISDPDTGAYIFPDPEQDHLLIAQIQQRLAARSGIPVSDILSDQEAPLTQGTPQNPQQTQPDTEVSERHPPRLTDGTQPEPRSVRETQSRPTLDEQQHSLLVYVTDHPGTPVAAAYKALGVGVALGAKVRESLKALGLLTELELRTGRQRSGRPSICLIPTTSGFQLVGHEQPPGRGGELHRQIQQLVIQGALAKGYSAEAEHKLASGGIVDVHLAKGAGRRIACEVAIVSTVEQEISHIRSCLAVGYDQIFTLFADEQLLAKVAAAIETHLSSDEQRKVRLLPLRQLASIG
jgi:hypothetical protein